MSGRGIDDIRPLAPALGALVPLLSLPVAELNCVYCRRLHLSPPDWAVPTICDAGRRYRSHSGVEAEVLKRSPPPSRSALTRCPLRCGLRRKFPLRAAGSVHSAPSGAPATMAVSPEKGKKRPVKKGHSHRG